MVSKLTHCVDESFVRKWSAECDRITITLLHQVMAGKYIFPVKAKESSVFYKRFRFMENTREIEVLRGKNDFPLNLTF